MSKDPVVIFGYSIGTAALLAFHLFLSILYFFALQEVVPEVSPLTWWLWIEAVAVFFFPLWPEEDLKGSDYTYFQLLWLGVGLQFLLFVAGFFLFCLAALFNAITSSSIVYWQFGSTLFLGLAAVCILLLLLRYCMSGIEKHKKAQSIKKSRSQASLRVKNLFEKYGV